MKNIATYRKFNLFEKLNQAVYREMKKDPEGRYINTEDEEIEFHPVPLGAQRVGPKPKGLWYSFGSEWVDFARQQMPQWEDDHLFKIEIDERKILRLGADYDMPYGKFEEKYAVKEIKNKGTNIEYENVDIDWKRVAKDYAGIEIQNPWGQIGHWQRPWDVSSGCIWGDGVIKSIEKII